MTGVVDQARRRAAPGLTGWDAALTEIDRQLSTAPEIPLAPAHLSDEEDHKENPTTAEKLAMGHQLFLPHAPNGVPACSACVSSQSSATSDIPCFG